MKTLSIINKPHLKLKKKPSVHEDESKRQNIFIFTNKCKGRVFFLINNVFVQKESIITRVDQHYNHSNWSNQSINGLKRA